jgi:hypothetical protein
MNSSTLMAETQCTSSAQDSCSICQVLDCMQRCASPRHEGSFYIRRRVYLHSIVTHGCQTRLHFNVTLSTNITLNPSSTPSYFSSSHSMSSVTHGRNYELAPSTHTFNRTPGTPHHMHFCHSLMISCERLLPSRTQLVQLTGHGGLQP